MYARTYVFVCVFVYATRMIHNIRFPCTGCLFRGVYCRSFLVVYAAENREFASPRVSSQVIPASPAKRGIFASKSGQVRELKR